MKKVVVLVLIVGLLALVVSPAYADNSGGGPLPRDSIVDTTGEPHGASSSGEESIIDAFMAVLDAILLFKQTGTLRIRRHTSLPFPRIGSHESKGLHLLCPECTVPERYRHIH